MQTDSMILVLSFGHGSPDGETFDLQVPEMVIPYYLRTDEEIKLQAQVEAYYLKSYQKQLNRLSKEIEALELEETNIFHTLATPLQDDELPQN
jgi:DNA integrity scanning protein DisA with diadenylate cyclase activity